MEMELRDIEDGRIERQIGDPFGRTPHFVIDGHGGVLYVPQPTGTWAARAMPLDDAITFLETSFPVLGQGVLL